MTYYREATVHTQELLDLLVKCENKIQTVRHNREQGGFREACTYHSQIQFHYRFFSF